MIQPWYFFCLIKSQQNNLTVALCEAPRAEGGVTWAPCMLALAYTASLLGWLHSLSVQSTFLTSLISWCLHCSFRSIYSFIHPSLQESNMPYITWHLNSSSETLMETSVILQFLYTCITRIARTRYIMLLFVTLPLYLHLEH